MSILPHNLQAALAGQYEFDREIGRGATATVYLARDLKHEREIALKVLHDELGASLGAERFLREIKLAARLQHPHILPLYDSGQAAGMLYYVTPYISGDTLRARLDRERALAIDDAVRLASEIASALDYAHRHSLIHRDVKPENILLHDGHAIVADFGIARATVPGRDAALTQTGLAVGTAAYMSPEQAAGDRDLDGRSDVYSLGCVLYEMLAGEPPFTGPSTQAIIARRFTEHAPSPRRVRESVPEQLNDVVLRALARDRLDRFPSAAHMAVALSAGALQAAPRPDVRSRGAPASTDTPPQTSSHPRARELYEQARRIVSRRASSELADAAAHLARALELDAEFASAHALMGVVHLLGADLLRPLDTSTTDAAMSARAALRADPHCGVAHAVLAFRATLFWDWPAADTAFARAHADAPNEPLVHHWYGLYLVARGRVAEARRSLAAALSLEPESAVLHTASGTAAYYARDFVGAIEVLQRAGALDPGGATAPIVCGMAQGAHGDVEGAIRSVKRGVDLAGRVEPMALTGLCCILAGGGRLNDARDMHDELRALARRADISPFYDAAASAALTMPGDAMDSLRRARDAKDSWMLSLHAHPWMDPLRGTPAFTGLLSDIGPSRTVEEYK